MLCGGTDKGIVGFELAKTLYEFLDAMLHIAAMLEHYKLDSIVVQLMWPDLLLDKCSRFPVIVHRLCRNCAIAWALNLVHFRVSYLVRVEPFHVYPDVIIH